MLKTPCPPANRSTTSPSSGPARPAAGQDQLGAGHIAPEVAAEALDCLAGLLELEAGVEQPLDHLELEHVPIGVAPLTAAAGGIGDRRPEEAGAGPVVQLAVGDAHQGADLRPAESVIGPGPVRRPASCCVSPPAVHRSTLVIPPPRSEVHPEPQPHGQPVESGYHTAGNYLYVIRGPAHRWTAIPTWTRFGGPPESGNDREMPPATPERATSGEPAPPPRVRRCPSINARSTSVPSTGRVP